MNTALRHLGQGLLKMVEEAQALAPRLKKPERIIREYQTECYGGHPAAEFYQLIPGYSRVNLTLEVVPEAIAEADDERAAEFYRNRGDL